MNPVPPGQQAGVLTTQPRHSALQVVLGPCNSGAGTEQCATDRAHTPQEARVSENAFDGIVIDDDGSAALYTHTERY
jgi:hypothetical protein